MSRTELCDYRCRLPKRMYSAAVQRDATDDEVDRDHLLGRRHGAEARAREAVAQVGLKLCNHLGFVEFTRESIEQLDEVARNRVLLALVAVVDALLDWSSRSGVEGFGRQ